METISDLQEKLRGINTYDDFFEVRRTMTGYSEETVFRSLWSLAVRRAGDESTGMAGYMLAELQPDAQESLESLLSQVHASELDASNRIVPFYLISQFGKHVVLQACARFIGALPQGSPRSRVDAVLYWAGFPASDLCKHFHDWEARDMYGVPDDA